MVLPPPVGPTFNQVQQVGSMLAKAERAAGYLNPYEDDKVDPVVITLLNREYNGSVSRLIGTPTPAISADHFAKAITHAFRDTDPVRKTMLHRSAWRRRRFSGDSEVIDRKPIFYHRNPELKGIGIHVTQPT